MTNTFIIRGGSISMVPDAAVYDILYTTKERIPCGSNRD